MATNPEPSKRAPPWWFWLIVQLGTQFGSRYVRDRYGVNLGVAVFVGMAGGALAGGLVYLLVRQLPRAWQRWRRELPVCLQGTCRGDDGYELVEQLPTGAVLACGCGTRYEQRRRSFEVRHADGTTSPFMQRRWLGGWRLSGGEAGMAKSPYRS